MRYYFNMFMVYSMLVVAVTVGTIAYISLFDPDAAKLVKLFVDCVVKIILLGH